VSGIVQRLLRLPLFAKVLFANSAIVALGAIAGIYLTAYEVRASPNHSFVELMLFFGVIGLALSTTLNALVLRAAFRPLTLLERTARRVAEGDMDARTVLGAVSDPNTRTLADSFNHMLATIQSDTRRLEEYSARLQELCDQVLMAQEQERRQLARALQDQTGQELATLLMSLRLLRDAAAAPVPNLAVLRAQAGGLAELARTALDGVRTLALDLHPLVLDDLGLTTALRASVEEWSDRTGVRATYKAAIESVTLPATTEIAVYRLVQEALANVAKHAAASEVTVMLDLSDGALMVEVQDNGRGMILPECARTTRPALNSATPSGPGSTNNLAGSGGEKVRGVTRLDELQGGLSSGMGLFGAQERIALVGGRFYLESMPEAGTTVRAVIPLAERSTNQSGQ